MDMEHVRITASLLAPLIRIRGTNETHYVGILNRQALLKDNAHAWGPIGGAASLAAFPEFGRLVERFGVSLYDPKSKDLRLRVPMVHVAEVIAELEPRIAALGAVDLYRELREELTGRELRRVSKEPILSETRIRTIGVKFLCTVRQPKNGGFVISQRVKERMPTKRILCLYELEMSRRTFKAMQRSPLIRVFDPRDLPGSNDPPAEPILLEDGTERRGHLMRIDEPVA